jgi:hypothetical protein
MLLLLLMKDTILGWVIKRSVVLSLVAGVAAIALTYDRSRVNHGRQLERQAIKEKGKLNADRANKARDSVSNLPADRLRDKYFRD